MLKWMKDICNFAFGKNLNNIEIRYVIKDLTTKREYYFLKTFSLKSPFIEAINRDFQAWCRQQYHVHDLYYHKTDCYWEVFKEK